MAQCDRMDRKLRGGSDRLLSDLTWRKGNEGDGSDWSLLGM